LWRLSRLLCLFRDLDAERSAGNANFPANPRQWNLAASALTCFSVGISVSAPLRQIEEFRVRFFRLARRAGNRFGARRS
jgi:hypothetical protein